MRKFSGPSHIFVQHGLATAMIDIVSSDGILPHNSSIRPAMRAHVCGNISRKDAHYAGIPLSSVNRAVADHRDDLLQKTHFITAERIKRDSLGAERRSYMEDVHYSFVNNYDSSFLCSLCRLSMSSSFPSRVEFGPSSQCLERTCTRCFGISSKHLLMPTFALAPAHFPSRSRLARVYCFQSFGSDRYVCSCAFSQAYCYYD